MGFQARRTTSGRSATDVKLGDQDGFGRHGVLDETPDGLLCHECGKTYRHLGLHVYRRHGMTAAEYREAHGLSRRMGMVSSELHNTIRGNAQDRMATAAGRRFIDARDPALATQVRLAAGSLNWRPAARAAYRSARAGIGRKGTIVTCQQCSAAFCPLSGATKRRFCSRSCASRWNRRQR